MRIQIRRGDKLDLPTFNVGEIGLADDTQEVYIGTTAGNIEFFTAASGVGDHGILTGLDDDDHTQYHNDTRGDARYLYKENVSVFTPDSDYEPSTKKYVDDEITTLSGNVVLDHGNLTGLGDDGHVQYSLVDGTRAFSSTVSGVTPVEDAHLATKGYTDDAITTATGSLAKEWVETTSDYNITERQNIFVNSISGSYTLTTYSNPDKGDSIAFVDNGGYCETNNVTISGGSEKLQGENQYLYIDENYEVLGLIYGGSDKGWIVSPTLSDFIFTIDQA